MNKTASIKDSPIKKNPWRPGSRGRVPDWYKEVNPNWKDDNKDTVAERKFKDLLIKEEAVHLDPWQARASSSMGSRLCEGEERGEAAR